MQRLCRMQRLYKNRIYECNVSASANVFIRVRLCYRVAGKNRSMNSWMTGSSVRLNSSGVPVK